MKNDNNGNDNNHHNNNDNDNDEEIDMNLCKIPMLASTYLPLTKNTISALLRDIVSMSNLHPQKKILSYKCFTGTTDEYTLLNTFRWNNKDACMNYTRQKKRRSWMTTLPKLISAKDDVEEGANWILTYYGKKYEGEFIKVCNKLGYPIRTKKCRLQRPLLCGSRVI